MEKKKNGDQTDWATKRKRLTSAVVRKQETGEALGSKDMELKFSLLLKEVEPKEVVLGESYTYGQGLEAVIELHDLDCGGKLHQLWLMLSLWHCDCTTERDEKRPNGWERDHFHTLI